MSKPTIIIGLPQSFGMHNSFKKNLEFYGFETIDISYNEHDFKYKNLGQKIYNFFRKTFLKDKGYKSKLKFQIFSKEVVQKLNAIQGKADYALLMRADIYPSDVIELVREKSTFMAGYQWDGLHRFPAIYPLIPFFDQFYVFDKSDLHQNVFQFYPITNFYFDDDQNENQNHEIEYDLFFVGTLIERRMKNIKRLNKKCKKLGLKPFINLYCQNPKDKEAYDDQGYHFIHEHMSYEENIKNVKRSGILLDFLNTTHEGLSFRTFEALHYNKKLITNNPRVKDYDFYHPNNIFIWNEINLNQLEDFIQKPYVMPDANIKSKYGFGNWIKYVLHIEPFDPITLPE